MNIQEYLKGRQRLIDRALRSYLKQWRHHPKNLYQAVSYSVFTGGKRLRPILTLASGELFGAKQMTLLPFACAVELIHTYSLIHDDLPALDDDDLRRGKLASHKKFGEGMALLAGDALLTEAFGLLAEPRVGRGLDSKLVLELIREIAHAAGIGGMVGGQAADLETLGSDVNIAMVESIHVRKTGSLIFTAAWIGARIGGATPAELRRVTRYAEFLGLAFQIADDILDTREGFVDAGRKQAGHTGKKRATYPAVVGFPTARARAQELLHDCFREVKPFGKKAEPLMGIAQYVVERAL